MPPSFVTSEKIYNALKLQPFMYLMFRKTKSPSKQTIYDYMTQDNDGYMTMIARVSDGTPLAVSVQEDTELGKSIVDYQQIANRMIKTLTKTSPIKCSTEYGPYSFHYIIKQDICFLTLCDVDCSKKSAYLFLEDISRGFYNQYKQTINTVNRQNLCQGRQTVEPSHFYSLDSELHATHKVGAQSINGVPEEGVVIHELNLKSSDLVEPSRQFCRDAISINAASQTAIGVGLSVLFFASFFWYEFFI